MSETTINGGISTANASFSVQPSVAAEKGPLETLSTTSFALGSRADRLFFLSGYNSVSGTMSVQGGTETLLGGSLAGQQANNSQANNLLVQPGTPGPGADTVLAGGAQVLVSQGEGSVIDLSGGFVTFLGGGSDAPNVIISATGNTSLSGSVITTDTFYGLSSPPGGGSTPDQALWLGSGNDTITLGTGADTVVASALGQLGDDMLVGWDVAKDVLYLENLGAPVFTDTPSGLRATLSDGTSISFAGLHDQSAIQIVFGKPNS
jgi:hypothetical protein